MSKITNINAIFQKAIGMFGPITAKPRDADFQRLNETLVMCTIIITITGTFVSCASGVVLPESVYQTSQRGSFDFMRDKRPEYDPDIKRLPKDDRLSEMRGMEHSWAAGTANQIRIHVVEVGAQNLILANVE